MSDKIYEIFRFKRVVLSKLEPYGFIKEDDKYLYSVELGVANFTMNVTVNSAGKLSAEVRDNDLDEIYTLHLVDTAVGSFIGDIRTAYEKVLTDIAENCTEPQIFKTRQAGEIIEYARAKFGSEPEYLWEKFPDNAVFRRADTKKWYGIIMTVKASKMGLERDGNIEVIDMRTPPNSTGFSIDNIRFFPGYHMNKQSWFTIILDDIVPSEDIFRLIDISYTLAIK